MAALVVTIAPAAGQATSAPKANTATAVKRTWTPPRTPDGQPDLQGVWTNNSVTPLQRPKELAGKEYYTEAELAEVQQRQRERLALDDEEGEPPANHSGVEGAPPENVHYDHAQFGLDWLQSRVAWNRRTSLIVGPEGTIPPLTPEARQRRAERLAKAKGHELDGPESRPLEARCLARASVGPPLLPTRYNSNLQIVQGPGYVAVEAEEIHDVRVIPLDGRPHLPNSIRQWMGDSVGHWEGNTLVIETTSFSEDTWFGEDGYFHSDAMHVTERLWREGENLVWQATVEDPNVLTAPWTMAARVMKPSNEPLEESPHCVEDDGSRLLNLDHHRQR
jgi:hypothetical protein